MYQTAVIPHEWFSHIMNNWGDNNGLHYQAYINEIDFPQFEKTTDKFKQTTVTMLKNKLDKFSINYSVVSPVYWEYYNKYYEVMEVIDLGGIIGTAIK